MRALRTTVVAAAVTTVLFGAFILGVQAHWVVRKAIVDIGTDQTARNSPAPDFALRDLDGNTFALSDFEGQRLLLTFWAGWNRESVGRLSDLNILAQAGWQVVAVNLMEDPDRVLSAAGRVRYPILLDPDGHVGRLYGVEDMPSVFLIHADGTVASLGTQLPEPIWLVSD